MEKKYKIILVLFILMLFSLINNYSAAFILSMYDNYFIKQLIWFLIGFFIIWLSNKLNISLLIKYSFYLYIIGNILLLLALIIGTNINGATRWIDIGFFSLQPSEFMKIFIILYLILFSKKKMSDFKYIIFSFIIILIPSILTFLEPDTGALIPYFLIWVAFLINKGINKWWYIISSSLILLLSSSFLYFYYNYQDAFVSFFGTSFFYRMDRLTNFGDEEGYQISRALTSIGSAGLFGRSLSDIPEYFPEAPTDFAFALLINNIGFVGIIIFLIIYSYFIYILISLINKKNKLLMLSIVLILLSQFSINILMNIGLMPIIGITLPFISYGGSSLISYFILISLAFNNEKLLI